jgi:protein-L-isoaspartate(D-aspartate) O-methyltransferase
MVSRRVQALLDQLRAQGIQDEQVLNALAAVPREKFVDEAFEQKAWDNIALPIGQGQTISQPYMVARMTELLELTPQSRVLEIGTGSGYQTAILAHLVQHVCSVERIKGLQWQARRRLKNLDLHNVSTRHGDGWQGWQARAPFDAIIVTAAGNSNCANDAAGRRRDSRLTRRGGAPVFETGASSGRRIYYRYRGGRALCPFSEG